MKKDEFIAQIEGGLIVSCQALPGEPLYRPEGGIMPMMAEAAYQAEIRDAIKPDLILLGRQYTRLYEKTIL